MLTKAIKAELKANVDKREIEGYAALFDDLDSDQDVIVKGAFATSIKGEDRRRVKVLWQHMSSEPIGRPHDIAEDGKGLYFRAKLTKGVQRADEALALVADGVIDEMSFGFDTLQSDMGEFKQKGGEAVRARFLKELKLWEISPVTWGANGNTSVAAAKALGIALDELKGGRVLSKRNLEAIMVAIEQNEAALSGLRSLVDAAMQKEGDADEEPEGDDSAGKKGVDWAHLETAAIRIESMIQKRRG